MVDSACDERCQLFAADARSRGSYQPWLRRACGTVLKEEIGDCEFAGEMKWYEGLFQRDAE